MSKQDAIVLSLAGSALVSFYSVKILIVLLGSSGVSLAGLTDLLLTSVFLITFNLIGAAIRRIIPTGIVFAALGGAAMTFVALNGTGPWFPWVRQIMPYVLMPLLNAFCFDWCIRHLDGPTPRTR